MGERRGRWKIERKGKKKRDEKPQRRYQEEKREDKREEKEDGENPQTTASDPFIAAASHRWSDLFGIYKTGETK